MDEDDLFADAHVGEFHALVRRDGDAVRQRTFAAEV
jgi:hypothetical protein